MDLLKHLDARAAETAEPTPAQAEAGNYRKGRVRGHGLPIVIETPRGAMRRGIGGDGKPWACRMPAHYGYISRTEGADGDHVDVYVGPHLKSRKVFVLDQLDADTGEFDEHKVWMGFASAGQVKAIYRKCFSDGKADKRRGQIIEMTPDEFRAWLKTDTTQPIARAAGGRVGYADGGDTMGGLSKAEYMDLGRRAEENYARSLRGEQPLPDVPQEREQGWGEWGLDLAKRAGHAVGQFAQGVVRAPDVIARDPGIVGRVTSDILRNPTELSLIKSAKEGLYGPGDALSGKLPMWETDPETGERRTSQAAIQRAMDTSGLAGGASFGAKPQANAVGSGFTGKLYHGSPETNLPHINPSERGPLGPGVYTTPHENLAQRYAGPDGRVYERPAEGLDIYRGNGHRTDDEYFGFKRDKERLVEAAEPEMRDAVAQIMDKTWGEGYPLYGRLRNLYKGDEGAQALFKRAGFDGLSGIVDGHEVLLFGPQTLMSDSGKAGRGVAAAARSKLPMDEASRMARAAEQGYDGPWYHGSERTDRLTESGKIDPRRATSGPMPFFTDNPEIASNYAKGKPDTSLMAADTGNVADYFTVAPKDIGMSGRSPITVEQSWHFLPPEVKRDILEKAPRIGYEKPDMASGPFTLHDYPASISPDQYDYLMKTSARGNPLKALRELWHDSGDLVGNETLLSEIYRLAGYPAQISEMRAPWTTANGILPAQIRMVNPLHTENVQLMTDKIIPELERRFARDRTRKAGYGVDMWDKNHRFTPREWIERAKEDYAKGDNSFIWTSIPDKITNALREMGYDGMIDTGGKMGGQGHRVAIPFGPEQVRSQFAKFDPKNLGKSGLLLSDTQKPGQTVAAAGHESARQARRLAHHADSHVVKGASSSREAGPFATPIDVYHGTQKTFDKFDPEALGTNSTIFGNESVKRHGFFFAEDPEFAESFSTQGGRSDGAQIIPANLDIKNPLYMPPEGLHNADVDALVAQGVDRRWLNNYAGDPRSTWESFDGPDGEFFVNAARAAGYDGVRFSEVAPETGKIQNVWVAFDPHQIRSKFAQFDPKNKGKSGLLLSDTQKPGTAIGAAGHSAQPFYSALEQAVGGINQPRMTGDAWLGTLRNKQGVKPEEMQYTGLQEFLESKKGQPVTKQEIQDHLAANQIELKEVTKGGDAGTQQKAWELAREHGWKSWDEIDAPTQRKYIQRVSREAGETPTKYHDYQLPGGENYREMLLTMPKTMNPEFKAVGTRTNELQRKAADLMAEWKRISEEHPNTPEARQAYADYFKVRKEADASLSRQMELSQEHRAQNYKSSHWDEPNILAHVRMNDRTIDGKRSLHLEEIQSDWHQQGRDRGYKSGDYEAKIEEAVAAKNKAYDNFLATPESSPEFWKASQEYEAAKQAVSDLRSKRDNGVPDAPFKKTWHELALKRMLREAAEKGYDRLSWTPGEAQAARYDLSQQVDRIGWARKSDGTYDLTIEPKDGRAVTLDAQTPDQLKSAIGKEMAEKIVNAEGQKISNAGYTHAGEMEGEGLKIGGEGMKGFYDHMIPKALEKLAKEYGVKVQKGDLPGSGGQYKIRQATDGAGGVEIVRDGEIVNVAPSRRTAQEWIDEQGGQPVWYIDIPDSLRKQAMERGFSLFEDSGHGRIAGAAGHQFGDDAYRERAVQNRNRGWSTGKSAAGWDRKRPDEAKGTIGRPFQELHSHLDAARSNVAEQQQWATNPLLSDEDRAFIASGKFRADGGRVDMAGQVSEDDFVNGTLSDDDFANAKPAAPEVSQSRALGEGFLSGASGNFRDEVYGASEASGLPKWMGGFRAPIGAARMLFGDDGAIKVYERERDAARAIQKAAQEQHPWTYGTGQVGGNVIGMAVLPEAKALQGAGMGTQMARGAVLGAEAGAISGAGAGENWTDRAVGAGIGAGSGAIGGAAAPWVGKGAAVVYDKFGRPVVNTMRGWANPEGEAARRLFAAIDADSQMINSGKVNGMTVQQWMAARQAGEPVTLAELGAGNTQSLLRSAANTSPEGRALLEKMVEDRFHQQSTRVADDVRSLVAGGANARKTADQLVAEYDLARVPAYKAAFNHPRAQAMWDQDFAQMASSPAVQGAIRMATVNAKDEAAKLGLKPPMNPFSFQKDGTVSLTDPNFMPNLQFWDVVKKNLDAGDRSSQQWAKILRNKLDSYQTGYDRARGIAATFFGERDALQAGRTLAGKKMDPATVADAMRKMNPAERELFREGYASDWAGRVIENMKDTQDLTKAMFNSPGARKMAETVFGPAGMRKLEARMALETIMDGARRAMGNSTTARQLIEAGLAGGAIAGYESNWDPTKTIGAGILAGGARAGLGHHLAAPLADSARRVIGKVDAKTAKRVAELLTSNDPRLLAQGMRIAVANNKIADGLRNVANRISVAANMRGTEGMGNAMGMRSIGAARAEEDQP